MQSLADITYRRANSGKYRGVRGAALALCSRAALYAGSIAKYGTVKIDGIVDIPSRERHLVYLQNHTMPQKIFTLHKYELYKKNSNKAQNFYEMFNKGNGNNSEYIFQKQYNVSGGKGHDWDKRNAPFSYRGSGYGCGMAPTLELVEAFQYTDGTDGS